MKAFLLSLLVTLPIFFKQINIRIFIHLKNLNNNKNFLDTRTNDNIAIHIRVVKLEILTNFSNTDKEIFYTSLTTITSHLDFFVLRFYYHFLDTKAGQLFQRTRLEHQYKMFYSSIDLIINHIENPHLLEDHLNDLAEKHKQVGVLVEHVDYFIGSFIKALEDIFIGDVNKQIITVWYKIIVKIMSYFEKKLWN